MNMLNGSGTSALSMTLLHSLWQGGVIALFTWLLLRAFASRSAQVKYAIATSALFAFFTSVVVTFFIIYTPQAVDATTLSISLLSNTNEVATQASMASYLQVAFHFLQQHQSWIITGWAAGVFIFSLRFVAGIAYLKYLRHQAVPVGAEWNELLQRLTDQLNITRVVTLCESITVQTPVVVGYLKPIILMPIGLLGGLSAEQVEVILVHELAHIRRHDYLINFIQSVGETIFFFNPFVWMISAWMRNEREHCCDDRVLNEGYSPRLYATTLFELETSREQTRGLALAFTGNKNQLLNRIKRIMERSTKNQNVKEKFIPVVLVMLGLVFASWLSIGSAEEMDTNQDSIKQVVVTDTTRKPKVATYSRTTVITYDESGKPHEEVVESFDGEGVPAVPPVPALDFEVPPVPAIDFEAPPVPDFDFGLAAVAPVPDFDFAHDIALAPVMDFAFDTFPHGFNSFNEEQMREFQQKFTEQFKAQFGDFYSKNQKEFDKMMEAAQKNMNHFDKVWAEQMEANALTDLKRAQLELTQLTPMTSLMEQNMQAAARQMKQAEVMARLIDDQARIAGEQMRINEDHLRMMEKNMKLFESELKDQLVKDGYIKVNESLKDIVFNPSGEISINGKKIKEADKKKYNDIHKKYFTERHFQRPE